MKYSNGIKKKKASLVEENEETHNLVYPSQKALSRFVTIFMIRFSGFGGHKEVLYVPFFLLNLSLTFILLFLKSLIGF